MSEDELNFVKSIRTNYSLIDMDGEIWKPVVGREENYLISNLGRLKAKERDIIISYGAIRHHETSILRQSLTNHSHCCINLPRLTTLGRGRHRYSKCLIHRLEAIAFIPNPNNKPVINHKNCLPFDNRLDNLEWNTMSENTKHAYDNGLFIPPVITKKLVCTKTGTIYNSIKDAADILGINRSYLYSMIIGNKKNKTTLIHLNKQK